MQEQDKAFGRETRRAHAILFDGLGQSLFCRPVRSADKKTTGSAQDKSSVPFVHLCKTAEDRQKTEKGEPAARARGCKDGFGRWGQELPGQGHRAAEAGERSGAEKAETGRMRKDREDGEGQGGGGETAGLVLCTKALRNQHRTCTGTSQGSSRAMKKDRRHIGLCALVLVDTGRRDWPGRGSPGAPVGKQSSCAPFALEEGVAGGKGHVEAAGEHGNTHPGSQTVDAVLRAAQEGGIGGQDAGQGKDESSPEQDNKGKFDEGHIFFLLEA